MSEFAHKNVLQNPILKSNSNENESIVDINGKTFMTGLGINLQTSYIFKNNYEIGLRASKITPDELEGFKELNEYTLGVSKYINGHKLKVQSDVSYQDFAGNSSDQMRYRLQMEIGS